MQGEYEIKSGDSRKKVANLFGVSVKELLDYNKPVLGDDWRAGVVVRDPAYVSRAVSSLREGGYPDEKIAEALDMTPQKLVERFGPRDEPIKQKNNSSEMLSKITDLPAKRGGGEILREVDAPRRGGRFPEVDVPQRSGRFPEVQPTQRGQVPIPRQEDPALEPISVPERSGRFPEISVDAKRRGGGEILREVDTPRRSGRFPDVQPTQKGQVPIPTDSTGGFVRGQQLGRLEVEQPPDVTARIPAQDIGSGDFFERDETPAKIEKIAEVASNDYSDIIDSVMAEEEAPKKPAAKAEQSYEEFFPTDIEPRRFEDSLINAQLDRSFQTIAQGVSAGASDELQAGITALFSDTPYAEARNEIMQKVDDQQAVRPSAALFQDIGGGVLGGGALVSQMTKRGASAAKAGAFEGALMGAGYAEGIEEKLAMGAGFAAFGGSIGKALDWATTPSSHVARADKDGGRTVIDDELDGQILIQSLKKGQTAFYRTNKGDLKSVEILSVPKKSGQVIVKDGSNQFAVPKEKIERIKLEGIEESYERMRGYDNARGQNLTGRRQVDDFKVDKETGEITAIQRDATWRDANNAGELWDSMKLGLKDWYDQKLTGADDMLMRRVSKEVGARFARASQNFVRSSTAAFRQIAEPLRPLAELADTDKKFKAMVMDFTNSASIKNATTSADIEAYVRQEIGEEGVQAWGRYLAWNAEKKAQHVDRLTGTQAYKDAPDHIHTQLTPEAKKAKQDYDPNTDNALDELAIMDDAAANPRTRGRMLDDPNKTDSYMNPFFTDFRRTMNLEKLNELAKMFSLKIPEGGIQPHVVFDRIEMELVERGIPAREAKLAADTMKDDFIGGSQTPNNWLQAMNSVGYAGSLAGPKSAILNLHDVGMAAVLYPNQLIDQGLKGMLRKGKYKLADQLEQNLGEFRNEMIQSMRSGEMNAGRMAAEVTRKGTDFLMQASGFSVFDRVGKNAITRMVLGDAVDNIGELAERWGFYFSDRELGLIRGAMKKHGKNLDSYAKAVNDPGVKLVEELLFAGLGQQQLISSSGRPAAWSRNPNLRFMWALRGFAIKQQALAMARVVDNIKEGNTDAAKEYMKRYVIYSAGGFGLINESRQWLMGDGEWNLSGFVMGMGDQIVSTLSINTIGLNDYQWGRMMRNGVTLTFLESVIPIGIDIPKDIGMDIIDAVDNSVPGKEGLTAGQRAAYPLAQFPMAKQPAQGLRNLEENIGLPVPDPMADIRDKYFLTEVPK